jgi:hypothetical protein
MQYFYFIQSHADYTESRIFRRSIHKMGSLISRGVKKSPWGIETPRHLVYPRNISGWAHTAKNYGHWMSILTKIASSLDHTVTTVVDMYVQ